MEALSRHLKIKSILIFLILFITVCSFVYYDSYKSKAFLFARDYISNNKDIYEKYGYLEKVWLNPFGISIKERGISGDANLNVTIFTNTGKHKLNIKLKKISNTWQVESVSERY